jgi:hypothetical protein
MSFASNLRRELADRALQFARSENLPYALSYGTMPVACFAPDENESVHGNFIRSSYRAIISNPIWRQRLAKVHTQARRSLPASDRGRWRELDSCMSSDALLMNIFCHPRMSRDAPVLKSLASMRLGGRALGIRREFR